ncbi:MAG: tRNA (cytidine(34)-2'-O)-methyltransferase [Planctomycetota bacterium]
MNDPLLIAPQPEPSLNIVLFQPEIPGNTGAIGRTALALGAKLWLVRPLGFQVDQKTLRRAGLDYWKHLDWEVADHWDDLLERLQPDRIWYFSRFATKSYFSASFERGDTLVFGCETSGLPKTLTEPNQDRLLRIPTTEKVRSLNLATSAGIVSYEAFRQISQSST